MQKLYYNEEEIISTKIGQELATLEDVENYMCLVGGLKEGYYIIEDGVIEVCGADEEYEIILIENIKNNLEKDKIA